MVEDAVSVLDVAVFLLILLIFVVAVIAQSYKMNDHTCFLKYVHKWYFCLLVNLFKLLNWPC